jgi:prepilin-type N-terminal cleavage/methylation domain-containing protein
MAANRVGWVSEASPITAQSMGDASLTHSTRRVKPNAGFTLLETLVALTIVALGFAYAFSAMPESLGAQDRARNLETATSLAQSLLAEAAPTDGTDQKFAWHIDTAPLDTGHPQQPGDFAGQTERVTIRWAEGKQDRSIALQTIRLGILPRSP